MRRTVCFEVGCIDHPYNTIVYIGFYPIFADTLKNAIFRPPLKPIIQLFVWTTLGGGILSITPVSDDTKFGAQNLAVINKASAVFLWEKGLTRSSGSSPNQCN